MLGPNCAESKLGPSGVGIHQRFSGVDMLTETSLCTLIDCGQEPCLDIGCAYARSNSTPFRALPSGLMRGSLISHDTMRRAGSGSNTKHTCMLRTIPKPFWNNRWGIHSPTHCMRPIGGKEGTKNKDTHVACHDPPHQHYRRRKLVTQVLWRLQGGRSVVQ